MCIFESIKQSKNMETEIIKATEFSAYTEILSLSFVPSLEEQETLFTEDYIILEF